MYNSIITFTIFMGTSQSLPLSVLIGAFDNLYRFLNFSFSAVQLQMLHMIWSLWRASCAVSITVYSIYCNNKCAEMVYI